MTAWIMPGSALPCRWWWTPATPAAAGACAAPASSRHKRRGPARPQPRECLADDAAQRAFHVAEDAGVVDRRRPHVILAIGDLAHRRAQDLAAAGLRQAGHHP